MEHPDSLPVLDQMITGALEVHRIGLWVETGIFYHRGGRLGDKLRLDLSRNRTTCANNSLTLTTQPYTVCRVGGATRLWGLPCRAAPSALSARLFFSRALFSHRCTMPARREGGQGDRGALYVPGTSSSAMTPKWSLAHTPSLGSSNTNEQARIRNVGPPWSPQRTKM